MNLTNSLSPKYAVLRSPRFTRASGYPNKMKARSRHVLQTMIVHTKQQRAVMGSVHICECHHRLPVFLLSSVVGTNSNNLTNESTPFWRTPHRRPTSTSCCKVLELIWVPRFVINTTYFNILRTYLRNSQSPFSQGFSSTNLLLVSSCMRPPKSMAM